MVTYALDTSAILRYLDKEAGGARVYELLQQRYQGDNRLIISAIHWGEIANVIARTRGENQVHSVLSQLVSLGLEVIPATADLAVEAGLLKARKKVPYADAFGAELARSIPGCVFVTADFDLKPIDQEIKIEFLPAK